MKTETFGYFCQSLNPLYYKYNSYTLVESSGLTIIIQASSLLEASL
jgi:hypothetical protein